MNAIAIDDEPMALEVVKTLAEKVPYLKLQATFTNALIALDYMQKEGVDLVFLDINMPDLSGIDFLNSLNKKPLVIFTTAYPEHAALGFELDAVDYLLKPFSFVRFVKSCNKAFQLYHIQTSPEKTNEFFIKSGYEQVKALYDDVLYIEGSGNYVTFAFQGRQIVSRTSITEVFNQLPQDKFIKVHRSFIVHLKKIDKVERNMIFIKSKKIPVSESYRHELIEAIRRI